MADVKKFSDATVNPGKPRTPKLRSKKVRSIGRFEIVKVLGQGGFATVYLAHDPTLQRRVALKVPKTGTIESPESRARFDREARAAAVLNHPSIVPVFEIGNAGKVNFIASAYCQGVSLADWLEEQSAQIDIRHAAAMVAKLAEAIHHAHQRGIIHRDLKPANILVDQSADHAGSESGMWRDPDKVATRKLAESTLENVSASHDDQPTVMPSHRADAPVLSHSTDALKYSAPVPGSANAIEFNGSHDHSGTECIAHLLRITDFGLSKSLREIDQELTVEGSIMGTPAYMSPEQAAGRKNVGAASDIFSLGTIFFELLTGVTPFRRDSVLQTIRAIEEDPLPSPTRFRKQISHDICAIVEKALMKSPDQRYKNAFEFAEDLHRWLDGRAVSVRQASTWERCSNWCRRNPGLAGSLTFAVCSLILGMSLVTWKWREANDNLRFANDQFSRAEVALKDLRISEANAVSETVKAKEAAESERVARESAERVSNFMIEVFRSPDPTIDGRDVKVIDVLDESLGKLAASFPEDHRTRLNLEFAIGRSYVGLGETRKARRVIRSAIRGQREFLPDDFELRMHGNGALANVYRILDELDKAEKLYLENSDLAARLHGKEDYLYANSLQHLATIYLHQSRCEEVIETLDKIKNPRQFGEKFYLMCEGVRGQALYGLGDWEEAAVINEEVLEGKRALLGEEHPHTLLTANNLAVIYSNHGETGKAVQRQKEILKATRKVMGESHPNTLMAMNNLSTSLLKMKRYDEALVLLEPLYSGVCEKFGPQHLNSLQVCGSLACCYYHLDRFEEARKQFLICREPLESRLGADHDRVKMFNEKWEATLLAIEESEQVD